MPRNVGFWPGSQTDQDTFTINFAPNLLSAAITGTPTVAGVNCTAVYVTHTPAGLVSYRITTAGKYSGNVEVTVALNDGRTVTREVAHRFIGRQTQPPP